MLSYEDSLKYIDSFINYERMGLGLLKRKFDLGKMRAALVKMGNPERNYRSVHIAGTKGKGSTAVFVSSILKEAGYTVGLYISPHLITPRERISINGEVISKDDFALTLSEIEKIVSPEGGDSGYSFFEMYTLLAILYFSNRKADFAVFECGLGGRLDATNVVPAGVSGITSISYDHTEVLGNRLEEIAGEKAGIIKPGSFCVSAPQKASVMEVITEKCALEKAALAVVGKDITYRVKKMTETGSTFDVFGKAEYTDLRTSLAGEFQAENSAVAVGISEHILGARPQGDTPEVTNAVKRGIFNAFIPGRLEILAKEPYLVIDGAHNIASAARLKYSVEEIFKYDRLILLLGFSEDKDIKGICDEIAPMADEIIATRAMVRRAADPGVIKGYIRNKQVSIARDTKEALGLALSKAGKKDLILATGSFFLIGEIRKLILGEQE